jgi:hypothetical protein
VAFGEREARAHRFERLADALHGAARERGVADQRELALLRCEQAGDHAHGRAGVAAVERGWPAADFAADAGDFDDAVFGAALRLAPSALMQARVEAQSAPVEKLVKREVPFGEGGQHAVAMADGFVAGQAQAAVDVFGGADEAFQRKPVETGNIENMRRRPAIESLADVRRDSLLTSHLDRVGDEALLDRVVDLRKTHHRHVHTTLRTAAPGDFRSAGIRVVGIEVVFGRGLTWRSVPHSRSGGDDQGAVRAGKHVAESLDGALVLFTVFS